jgi:hypothetical protein
LTPDRSAGSHRPGNGLVEWESGDLDDRKALEAFVVDNDDLERLEAILGELNILEAISAVRHELRHSELLAFLLDPKANHGLRDAFLRRFLQRAVADVPRKARLPRSTSTCGTWTMSRSDVSGRTSISSSSTVPTTSLYSSRTRRPFTWITCC